MTTGILEGYAVVCFACGSKATTDIKTGFLHCSNNNCSRSKILMTKRVWGYSNCQGHCARLENAERESTITPEEVDQILERSLEEVERDLRPTLRKVFRKPPRQIILD